jgi:hypothetical protein
MARAGNLPAKKAPPWLDSYDLDTYAGVDAFTKELLKATWTGVLGTRQGVLGTRQAADCLATLRLLLERRLWLPTSGEAFNPEVGKYGRPSPERGAIEEAQRSIEHHTEEERAQLERLLTMAQERASAKDPDKADESEKDDSDQV